MNILVAGSTGQLALSMLERAAAFPDLSVSTAGRPDLDLEHPERLGHVIASLKPDVLVNAAAYTAVDQAEDEPARARQINTVAPAVLAGIARDLGIPFIHVSTDYVFDGEANSPYREDDPTNPRSVYGRTKLAGELAVRSANPEAMIVRTAWVYSPFGRNFVRTMLALAETRDELRVVADQFGTPTSSLHLADGLLHAIAGWHGGNRTGQGRLYHLAGTGTTNWYDLAEAIFETAAVQKTPPILVHPITTEEYPTRARRPRYSALDSERFATDFGWTMPRWQTGLGEVLDRLAIPRAD